MVTTENFPTELCSREAKEQFARAVLKERANKRKLQVLVAGGPEYNYIYHRSNLCQTLSRKQCASFPSSREVSLDPSMQRNWSNWGSEIDKSSNNQELNELLITKCPSTNI